MAAPQVGVSPTLPEPAAVGALTGSRRWNEASLRLSSNEKDGEKVLSSSLRAV
jgi:hypothetical protein